MLHYGRNMISFCLILHQIHIVIRVGFIRYCFSLRLFSLLPFFLPNWLCDYLQKGIKFSYKLR